MLPMFLFPVQRIHPSLRIRSAPAAFAGRKENVQRCGRLDQAKVNKKEEGGGRREVNNGAGVALRL